MSCRLIRHSASLGPLASLALFLTTAPSLADGPNVLRELNGAVSRLAARVTPAVVQIEVSGYGVAPEAGREETGVVVRQHSIGSGVIVDPSGYLLTNAHVIRGAQRIVVSLASPQGGGRSARRTFIATVVGSEPRVDLALLKIEASGLAHLPLDANMRVKQGELVFAVGSPQGLGSTVTMGIVGSEGRQVEFAPPVAYIQTDAPINPGNSGGPLVNVDGAIVGINTFILSQSGGSQGLGFAIPASIARPIFDQLRKHGHTHRIDVGVATQAITPELAAGLALPRDWGVVVADVALGGAARRAGVQIGDVVDSLDGRPVESLAGITSAVYEHAPATPLVMGLLRGSARLTLRIDAPEAKEATDQLVDLAHPEKGLVRKLGIIGIEVSEKLVGVIPPLLIGSGVVVAARTLDSARVDVGLQVGDVIHSVNRTRIASVEALRQATQQIRSGEAAVLQVERQGKLAYLAFEME